MACLTLKKRSYYGVFSGKTKKIWKRIGRVGRKEAKQILKRLEREYELDRLNLIVDKLPWSKPKLQVITS